jgi:mitochondrial fission protein ELM1
LSAIIPDIALDRVGQTPANRNNAATSIRIISDGTAGMRLQAIALGEEIKAIKDPTPTLDDIIISPPPLLRHLPRLAKYLPLTWLLKMVGSKLAALSSSNPTIIITCGRRMAGTSIAMRRLGMASNTKERPRTIHIQDPRLPPHYFDILIVPKHDKARGSNVITSMASLNWLDESKITAAAATLDPKWTSLPSPCIAVLLGGQNQRYDISSAMIDDMAKKMAKFAASTGASLALIPSRRTPDKLLTQLGTLLKTTPHAVMDAKDKNPYPGILGYAKAIIVTSDSVNMASEAAITGKPVLIAEWQKETGRIGAFHDAMKKAGHTAPLGDGIPKTNFTVLFEMPLILRQVTALLPH